MIGNKLYAFKNIIKSGMAELGRGQEGPIPSRSVNPISTKVLGRLCPPQFYSPPKFSVLLTSLKVDVVMKH